MTTSHNERAAVPTAAAERTMLESWLEFHRSTLAAKCEGLDEAQLRLRPVPPSELSLLGLIRHLADVERNWFRRVLAGEEAPPLYYDDEDRDGDFHPGLGETFEEATAAWRAEIEHARITASQYTLDALAAGRSHSGDPISLRWIYVHMIEEYARHNGHADLLRESIDGITGV